MTLITAALGGPTPVPAHEDHHTDHGSADDTPHADPHAHPATHDRHEAARVTSGAAFNPRLAIVLDGVYYSALGGELREPAGFAMDDGHGHAHGTGHGGAMREGFNLRETAFELAAAVDPYFRGFASLVVEGTDHVELEEAYIATSSLPAGMSLKAGRFLSDIGHINSQHPDDWHFVDRPLMNQRLFGDHGLLETGVQLAWHSAADPALRFGLELLQGETSGIARYEGPHQHEWIQPGDGNEAPTQWQADTGLDRVSGPRLVTAFAKLPAYRQHGHALQFGLFGGYATTWQDLERHESGRLETWEGEAWFAGLESVYGYAAGRHHGHGDWAFQAEYVYRELDLDYASREFAEDDTLTYTHSGAAVDRWSQKARQDGLYIQAIHGIAPRWDVGLRAEALGIINESLRADREYNRFDSFASSYRYAVQTSYAPTGSSRLRLQVNYNDFHDESLGARETAWELMLQYNMVLGTHSHGHHHPGAGMHHH